MAPKTKAGSRTVPLSGWLVEALQAHQGLTGRAADQLFSLPRPVDR